MKSDKLDMRLITPFFFKERLPPKIYFPCRWFIDTRGKNIIQRACTAKQCEVEIRHVAGEEVTCAIIKFKMEQGKVKTATLQCIITPVDHAFYERFISPKGLG